MRIVSTHYRPPVSVIRRPGTGLGTRTRYTSSFTVGTKQKVQTSSFTDFLIDQSYLVGKSITLFTLFWCSMNFVMYNRARRDMEKFHKMSKFDEEVEKKDKSKSNDDPEK